MSVRRSPTACVRKILSFHTAGVELPRSGSGTFQRTFSVALHFKGKFASNVTPKPLSPRHPAQFAQKADETQPTNARIRVNIRAKAIEIRRARQCSVALPARAGKARQLIRNPAPLVEPQPAS